MRKYLHSNRCDLGREEGRHRGQRRLTASPKRGCTKVLHYFWVNYLSRSIPVNLLGRSETHCSHKQHTACLAEPFSATLCQ